MKKIILDGKEVETFVPESLPMLIHGIEGSGASLYTICLAAKWFSQNYEILFLCGYSMAEEQFIQQVGIEHSRAIFFTKEKTDLFTKALANANKETIIFIKNIELFNQNAFEILQSRHNIIISGDLSKLTYKNQLLANKFTTEIYFSPLPEKTVPQLEKFQGFVMTKGYKGFTTIL